MERFMRAWVAVGWMRSCVLFVIVAASACSDQDLTGAGAPVNSRLLTEEVAAKLSQSGTFHRQALEPQPFRQIGYDQAARYAEAYVRTFGAHAQGDWSREHGTPVSAKSLKRCGDVLYASSVYDLGPVQQHLPLLNFVAGQFLVYFCKDGVVPQVLVSVSEAATFLEILRDGRLVMPDDSRAAHSLDSEGIPAEVRGTTIVPSIDEAVRLASEATGQRIASVPKLVRAPFPYPASFSRWHVELEYATDVRVGAAAAEFSSTIVYVGFARGRSAPAGLLAPTSATTPGFVTDSIPVPSAADGSPTWLKVRRVEGSHAAVEPATIVRRRN